MFSMIFIEMSKKYPVYSLNNLGVGDIAEIFAQLRMLTKGVPLSNWSFSPSPTSNFLTKRSASFSKMNGCSHLFASLRV